MADKDTGMTSPREGRLHAHNRPYGMGAGPFTALQRFADQMDRMFEDFGFGHRWGAFPAWRHSGLENWAPDVELFQRNNEVVIKADLPGLKRDEVSVEITDESVTIHGERKREHDEEREGFYRSERTYGSFYRVIPLPEGAMTDQAKAAFRDGVLEITMPAPPSSKGRKLEITEGAKK